MIRQRLISSAAHSSPEFEWRSREVSRLEGLSDTVFGFAITLLIVSLEVPRTSGQLLETMRGFVAFALTFGVLYALWYRQFLFFRRYGLEDGPVVLLNGLLLLFVLFFVFPFKFLANALVNHLLGLGKTVHLEDGRTVAAIQSTDWPMLFAVYGLGFAAIFAVFSALYYYAYTKRDALALNPLEIHDTRESVRLFLINGVLGVVVGFNGLIMGTTHASAVGTVLASAMAIVEVVAAAAIVRFRITRKRRRAAIMDSLNTSSPPDQVPIHAH